MRIQQLSLTLQRPSIQLSRAILAAMTEQPPVALAEPILGQLVTSFAAPAIGDPWPDVGGAYAGVARAEDGQPDGHLVLLDDVPDAELKWADAVKWAQDLGNGARLPTRFESALLYANLQKEFSAEGWYWTGTQYSAGYAWLQDFDYGGQNFDVKSYEARARAVRRFAA
jgi:hypothetical protein